MRRLGARGRCVARKPQSLYALTKSGRKALLDYVAHLENLLPPGSMSATEGGRA